MIEPAVIACSNDDELYHRKVVWLRDWWWERCIFLMSLFRKNDEYKTENHYRISPTEARVIVIFIELVILKQEER